MKKHLRTNAGVADIRTVQPTRGLRRKLFGLLCLFTALFSFGVNAAPSAADYSKTGGASKISRINNSTDTTANFALDKLGLTLVTQPAAAYSLRLLSSSYTGPLLRIRIDTVFYDVYPDATASRGFSLSSPVSAACATFDAAQTGATSTSLGTVAANRSAGVVTWYDQSPNARNAVQGNMNALPQIINTGAITTANNKPALNFTGSQWLTVTTTALNTNMSGSVVYNATSSNNTSGDGSSWYQMRGILGSEVSGTVNDFSYGIYNGRFTAGNGPADISVAAGIRVNDGITRLISWTRQSSDGTVKLYSNQRTDQYAALNTGELNSVSSLAIGATTTGGDGAFYGSLSEIVLSPLVYNDTQRLAIESSQATYYQIVTPPTIAVTNDLPALTGTTRGTASAASSFVVAGYQLTGGILVTAPDGFEVGKDNTTFAPAVTVGTGGDIVSVPVYIRLSAAAAAGNNLGNVILSSAGAASVKVGIAASTVLPQAGDGPTANYGTSHIFALDEPITPVTPLGANVGALGYNSPVAIGKSIGSGFVKAVVDSAGNTYLISSTKATIQVVPANGAAAYEIGGPFNSPVGMALDKAGNLYVAERTALYKVVPATGINTPVPDISLTSATSIAADDYGNLYIVNRRRIYKYEIGTSNFNEIDTRIAGVVNIAAKGNTLYYSVLLSSQQGLFRIDLDGGNRSIVTQSDGFAVDGDLTGHVYGGGLTNISRYGGDDGQILNVGAAYNLSTDLKGNIYYAATQDSLVKKLTPSGGYFIDKPLPLGLSLNGSTGIISGTPQALSPAVTYTITAYTGKQSVVSTFTLATVLNNRDLGALTVSGTTIGASFDANTTSYNAVTAASQDTLTITPTVAAAGSTVTCNGVMLASGSAIKVPVVTGANTISLVVTSVFGTAKTYTLNIKRGVRVSLDYGPAQTFTVNKAITAITPAAANVLPWGYDNPRKKITSDFISGNYLTALTDSAGTIYVVWQNLHPDDLGRNYITVVPADGGATYRIGGPFHYISAAIMDKEGNLYVAIEGGEIFKVVPSTNTVTLLPFSITNPRLSSLALDDKGHLYIGDAHNGLYILDQTTGITTKVDSTKSTNSIAIFENYIFYNDFGVSYRSELDGKNKIITGYPGSQQLISFFDPAGYYYGLKIFVSRLGKGKYALDPTHDQIIKGLIKPKDTFNSSTPGMLGDAYDGETRIDNSATIDGKGRILSGLAGAIFLETPSGGYYIDKRLPRGMDFDAETGIISGTPTSSSPKTDYHITAYNEQENAVSTFTFGVENNLQLTNLVTDAGSLTPTFNADSTGYRLTVNSSTTAANITAALSDTTNRLTIGGVAATSGAAASIALNIGSNTIPVVVTAQDGITNKTYTITITRPDRVQAITFSPIPTKTYGDAAFMLTATGGSSGNPVVYSSANPAVATISGNIVTITGAGTTVITADQAGDTNHDAAPQVSRTLTVNPTVASASISFSGWSPVSYGTPDFIPGATSSNTGVAITYSSSNNNVATIVNGKIHLVGIGTTVITASQAATDGNHQAPADVSQTLTVSASNVKTLSSLNVSSGTLSPAFNKNTEAYTATVANAVSTIRITPSANDATATVTVNGTAVNSGVASASIPLAIGANTISTVVTAQDGSTKTYVLTVTRAGSSNAYLSNLELSSPSAALVKLSNGPSATNFSASVPFSAGSIRLKLTTQDAGALVTINGVAAVSGVASDPILLSSNATLLSIRVTAADGTTVNTYSITVNKTGSSNAYLSNLELSSPSAALVKLSSGPSATNFSASVPVSAGSIRLKLTTQDTGASVTINGVAAVSGVASEPILLSSNATLLNIRVKAADGTTVNTYSITVNKTGSSNAYLSNLELSNPSSALVKLSSGPSATNFSASVPVSAGSIRLKLTTQDAGASVTINGVAAVSGVASEPILLSSNATLLNIRVKAADGTTVNTYSITVNKTGSSNAYLSNLELSNPSSALVKLSSGPSATNFSASVPVSAGSIRLKLTTQDAGASVTINGVAAVSGVASDPILLSGNATLLSIRVTAADAATINTYSITVNKASQSTASVTNKNTNIDVVQQPAITDEQLQAELTVHQAVSPNGDGINDRFTIDGIGAYPQNTVSIMNRNGDVIFTASGYDNYNKAFDGHAGNGTLQQAGTYFYSIEYKKGEETLRKTGYIVLKY